MTQTMPSRNAAPAVTIRGYRPADHQACRRLWAELTAEHRRRYPGSLASPVSPVAGDEPGGAMGPVPQPDDADPGAGFEEYLTRLDLSGMWVAQHPERGVLGFAGLILRGRSGSVDPVVVTAQMRGQGIGRALLSHVAEQGRRRGLRELRVSPALRNGEAVRCLAGAGFRVAESVTLSLDLTGRRRDQAGELELYGARLSY